MFDSGFLLHFTALELPPITVYVWFLLLKMCKAIGSERSHVSPKGSMESYFYDLVFLQQLRRQGILDDLVE